MSLKIFHFVFITLSSLACMGLGLWAFQWAGDLQWTLRMTLGSGGFLAAAGLIYYGGHFYQKVLKNKNNWVVP